MMKKRILSLMMVLWVLCAFVPCVAGAAEKYGDYLSYTVNADGKGVTITNCSSNANGNIVIPEEIDGLPVTTIGNDAFNGCTSMKGVTIPDSVTSIGNGAFLACYNLVNIIIPDSVITIGQDAFAGCMKLENVVIGNSVTIIGDDAFGDCHYLTAITIPDSVKSIGEDTFYNCYGLETVTIGNGVTTIGEDAFRLCRNLEIITIGKNVKSIGKNAFNGCNIIDEVYYLGTKEQWKKISIESGNDKLTGADFFYGGYAPIRPAAITVTETDGTYQITASTRRTGTAYAAVYGEGGTLLSVTKAAFINWETSITPDIPDGAKYIKFFVWTNNVQPVTTTQEITLAGE